MARLAMAASLALASCATTPARPPRQGGGFWADLAAGRFPSLSEGSSEAIGFVLKRARMAVTLSPVMPKRLPDGTYDLDFNHCVVLLVSDAQYALLETGMQVRVQGEFGVRNLGEGGDIVTTPSIRDRRAQPVCSSAGNWTDSLLFYVEDFSKVAP